MHVRHVALALSLLAATTAVAQPAKPTVVSLATDRVGAEPTSYLPMDGNWVVTTDAGEKVVMVDGRAWARAAMLEDRQRLRAGRKQSYATQMHVVNGTVEPYPTEDLAHVDLRRDGAQLPPLAVSLCLAREAHR